jgi:leucyl aminopeptidase
VLADGLLQAAAVQPNAIVDVATLTGGCVAALGRDVSGLFASDDALAARVGEAAERAGENVWRLPLHARYKKNLDSDVADLKNVAGAGPQAGAIHAALFLQQFTNGVPWAHLDIAGTARSDADDGEFSKGATGVSVRTLVELARRFAR